MFYFLLGYAACVLFPIPWINSSIITLWARLFAQVEGAVKGSNINQPPITPAPPTRVPPARHAP